MKKKWWQEAVVYEIYCKSFCDSNGDGIGDLRGVISKLHILRDLGVNCIWFTPIYTSPQVDNGYDVADYKNIDPAYGSIEDFKELLDMAHGMGIRVIMDMVLNHSSDECEWFKESRKSKDNPYRNITYGSLPKRTVSNPITGEAISVRATALLGNTTRERANIISINIPLRCPILTGNTSPFDARYTICSTGG